MLDRQKIRDEISDAAQARWTQLNEVGMQGIVAAECADIAMRILDAYGAFEQPQDKQDVCTCGEPRKVCELRTEVDQMGAALNAAYRERAHLVALLAAVYPSHIGRTDPAAPDWPVVTLQTPAGQAAWHISAADEDLFQHVEHDPEHAFEYDGHSTEEKYARIRTLTAEIAAVQEATEPDVMAVPVAEVRRAEQDERDGDVRAVADALDLIDGLWSGDARPGDVSLTRIALYDRFADRIAALDARDAKGGEQR